MQTTASEGGGSMFARGGRFGRASPEPPRDPVEVRRNLRRGATGAWLVAAGLPFASAWVAQRLRFLPEEMGAGTELLAVLLAVAAGALIVFGAYFALDAWLELPPRSFRSKSPGLVGLGIGLVVCVVALINEYVVTLSIPGPTMIGFFQLGLTLQFLLAGWAVWALPWRPRAFVAPAFALGGLAWIPGALYTVGVVVLPERVTLAAAIAAPALLVPALVAFGLGARRASRVATDEQLA